MSESRPEVIQKEVKPKGSRQLAGLLTSALNHGRIVEEEAGYRFRAHGTSAPSVLYTSSQ
jgi:hypothetical protein